MTYRMLDCPPKSHTWNLMFLYCKLYVSECWEEELRSAADLYGLYVEADCYEGDICQRASSA